MNLQPVLIELRDELESWQFNGLCRGDERACNDCEHYVSHNYRAARTAGDPLDCHEEEGDWECEGEPSTCPIVSFDTIAAELVEDNFFIDENITTPKGAKLINDMYRGNINDVKDYVAWAYKMHITHGDYDA